MNYFRVDLKLIDGQVQTFYPMIGIYDVKDQYSKTENHRDSLQSQEANAAMETATKMFAQKRTSEMNSGGWWLWVTFKDPQNPELGFHRVINEKFDKQAYWDRMTEAVKVGLQSDDM